MTTRRPDAFTLDLFDIPAPSAPVHGGLDVGLNQKDEMGFLCDILEGLTAFRAAMAEVF